MSGGYQVPVFNSSGVDAIVTDINYVYGARGAGARYRFWALYAGLFFRDSVAQKRVTADGSLVDIDRSAYPTPGSPLQSMNGIYPLFQAGAKEVHAKGIDEGRTRGDRVGVVQTPIITATRYDNRCTPVPIRQGYDPTGLIQTKIMEEQVEWGSYLPLKLGLSALVNGTIPLPNGATQTLTTYGGKALFATDHPVNPQDKKLKGVVFSNTLTLPANPTEMGWAEVQDKILEIVGFDGATIVHESMATPIIYVATNVQALHWLRFISGEKAADRLQLQPLVINGTPVGVSSVSMGSATIIVDPYLKSVATDKTDILKRAFIFPNSGYGLEPLICREEQVPVVQVSKPTDYQGFESKVIEIVSDSIMGFGLGDPRGIFEVRTP